MSIGGCKDVDYEICKYLEDEDVLSLSKTNCYYFNILNKDIFWKRRFLDFLKKEGKNLNYDYNHLNEPWKKYYLFIKKWYDQENIKTAIERDYLDLLLILLPANMQVSLYSCIEKDSVDCFKFLCETKKDEVEKEFFIYRAIDKRALKIVNYLLSTIKKTKSNIIIDILKKNLYECVKFIKADFEDLFENLVHENKLIEEMLMRKNIAFSLLIESLTYDQILNYKHKYNIYKLLTVYTSPFSIFSYRI
jgi:hypothetical protein